MAIIDKPGDFFNPKIYTGNGGGQSISGVGFQPNLIWLKSRSNGNYHNLTDSVRGNTKQIYSNDTNAEATKSTVVTSFNSDGFGVGSEGDVNGSGRSFVSWNWKEQAGVFDIVAYTGNGSNRTISHNLGSVPTMFIVKELSNSNSWEVYHIATGPSKNAQLNSDAAFESAGSSRWNSTAPTSSVFSIGTDSGVNRDGSSFICYLFGDSSMSKMGSYIGNGIVNGPFVYTNFKPAFILGKRTTSGGGWWMLDSKRPGFNVTDEYLLADSVQTEADDGSFSTDFLSNGWKARTNNGNFNTSGETYIYMAFAENPIVSSTDNGSIPACAR